MTGYPIPYRTLILVDTRWGCATYTMITTTTTITTITDAGVVPP